ncbi:MAG TPA: phosphopantetheine-binding protein [Planctomycetota bacterium]|nr:phosphopantetheine-binding protein [Planctomycetota bacterium]
MDSASLRNAVVEYLSREANLPAGGLTSDDHDLIADGIIDSFGLLGLIAHLESRFKLQIDASDIDPANFNTVARIVNVIQKR